MCDAQNSSVIYRHRPNQASDSVVTRHRVQMKRDALTHPRPGIPAHNEDTQDRVNVTQRGLESQKVSF